MEKLRPRGRRGLALGGSREDVETGQGAGLSVRR